MNNCMSFFHFLAAIFLSFFSKQHFLHKTALFVGLFYLFLGTAYAQNDTISPKLDTLQKATNKKGGGVIVHQDSFKVDTLAIKTGGKKGSGIPINPSLVTSKKDSSQLLVKNDSLKNDTIAYRLRFPPSLYSVRKWEKAAYLYTIRRFPPVVAKILTPLDTNRQDPDVAYMRSLIIPGWGQAYNRAYWKIPIVYVGLAGAGYWIYYNNQLYRKFQSAYYFEVDSDTTTSKIDVAADLASVPTEALRSQRNQYRTTRDQGIMIFALAYSLQIIEAYVNAHLKYFDVSDNMAIHVQPTYIPSIAANSMSLRNGKAGIGLTLRF
jgi:Family of unknown function (DUF5683)